MNLLLLLALCDLFLLGAAGAGPVKVAAKTPWKEKEEIQKKGRQTPSSEKQQKRQQTTSGADATIPKLGALFEWLHHSGGFIDQRLSFQKTSGRGRGIVATAAIPKDELTIWLPKTQMILARDDLKLAEGTFKELMQTHQAAWASYPGVEEHVEPVARVAANLALEAQRGGESRFHPYIASLPSSCPANLLTASPGLRRWMQDTPARWIPSFQNISLQVLNMLLDGRGVSKALQKWSLCMVLSRAHSHTDFGVALWPCVDLANHASLPEDITAKRWENEPKAGYDAGNRWDSYLTLHHASASSGTGRFAYGAGVGLATSVSLDAGAELLWSYGWRGNVELQASYGFSEDKMHASMRALELPQILSAPGMEDKSSQDWLARLGCYTDPEDLLTVANIPLRGEGDMHAKLLSALQCVRRWIRGPSAGKGKLPKDWTVADMPVLNVLMQACEQAAAAWVKSVAMLPSTELRDPLALAAFAEGRSAEKCAASVRTALRRLAEQRRASSSADS